MADCWICGAEADKWTHPEARLCDQCWSRGTDGLRALDFGIVERGGSLEVEAPPNHAPIITLVFRAETYGTIVKKLIKRELQIGREDVDDQVYFEVASESDIPYLRGYEASELMATLSEYGQIEVSDARALVNFQAPDPDREKVAMFAASLLHFIRARQNMVRSAP